MSILDTSLFTTSTPFTLGVGYHNIGSGVLRASHSDMIKVIEEHYGERCGHIPLEVEQARVQVALHTPSVDAQIRYLSNLMGKQIRAVTETELMQEQQGSAVDATTLVVPYINTPQTEELIASSLHGTSWGLPSVMVDCLKNKASFYALLDEFALADWLTPDYRVVHIADMPSSAYAFLRGIEAMLQEAGIAQYPLGLMMRAAESDGNYGCCQMYEQQGRVWLIPNGAPEMLAHFASWPEALQSAQEILLATMDVEKESRIVVSRFIELADSPGLSVVIMDGQVSSLRWNGQLQKDGSLACVGTSSYQATTAARVELRARYEDETVACIETILRKTAQRCNIDFATIRGLANIDIMLPGPLEQQLQQHRGMRNHGYLAECNPRWTNYTDAIMTIMGANRQAVTTRNILATIEQGILAVDKYILPVSVDIQALRTRIADADERLKQNGTRIICRMAKHPLGVIFAGDLQQGQQTLRQIVEDR